MFRKLIVENYKSWAGPHEVELRPLTLIYGPNSSGKSSLLQPLVLLKQTFEAAQPKINLHRGGLNDLVSVGPFDSLIHHPSLSSSSPRPTEMTFGFSFAYNEGGRFYPEVENPGSGTYEVTFREVDGVAVVSHLKMSTNVDGFGIQHWILERGVGGKYTMEQPVLDGQKLKQQKIRVPAPQRALPSFEAAARERLSQPEDKPNAQLPLLKAHLALFNDVVATVGSLGYLGPVRLPPRREYHLRDIEGSGGGRGERALVSLFRGDDILDEDLRKRLLSEVEKWVRVLGLGEEVSVSKPESDTFRIFVHREGVAVNLADVGYGVGQALPVIASIVELFMFPMGYLIIEEPESHLHPAAQAALGDLLVDMVAPMDFEKQLIIETHSEQLLQRVRLRMARGDITPERVAVYHCHLVEGASAIKQLEMDEYGRIKDWPEKFFGDPLADSAARVRAMLDRLSGKTHG